VLVYLITTSDAQYHEPKIRFCTLQTERTISIFLPIRPWNKAIIHNLNQKQ